MGYGQEVATRGVSVVSFAGPSDRALLGKIDMAIHVFACFTTANANA